MKLSILILSIPSRADQLVRLLERLTPQITPDVEVLIALDSAASKAEKRNQLLDTAHGEYVCYVDDDDMVAPHYVAALIAAMQKQPDCVTFKVHRWFDGDYIGEAQHRLANREYGAWRGTRIFTRPPNHLTPVRTALAKAIRFNEVEMEDIDYALRLLPHLLSEEFIDDYLYEYLLKTKSG